MYEYAVKRIAAIVDGDTIDIEIDLGFGITRSERVRLAGIDTPETRTSNKEEKKLGLEAKKWLSDQLLKGEYKIRTVKENETEKYGRMLGWLYKDIEADSVNNQMIKLGYAWPYDGTKKNKDLNELLKIREKLV